MCVFYLIRLMGSSSCSLALLAGSKFGQVTMIITLPAQAPISVLVSGEMMARALMNIHLVVKYFGLA